MRAVQGVARQGGNRAVTHRPGTGQDKENAMLKEFGNFIARGNVMDMAVGIIIGAAFTAIVSSMVDDLVNPLIGLFIGGIDFAAISFGLGEAQFMIGNFINAVIKFVIIAWVVFLLVRGVNRVREAAERRRKAGQAEPEAAAPEAQAGLRQEELLTEIRDLLKAR